MVGTGCLPLMRLMALLAAAVIFAPGVMCQADPDKVCQPMLILVENDNGRTMDIRVGQTVKINLPENATTGYRWAIDQYDAEIIEAGPTEPHYPGQAIGSGGEVSFIFQGKKSGSGEIVLKHWRHWEGEPSVTKRFRLRLNVKP